jgi:hypothetical protein
VPRDEATSSGPSAPTPIGPGASGSGVNGAGSGGAGMIMRKGGPTGKHEMVSNAYIYASFIPSHFPFNLMYLLINNILVCVIIDEINV